MSRLTTVHGGSRDRRIFIQDRATLKRCRELPVARRLYTKGLGSATVGEGYAVERPKGISDHILLFCEAGRGRLEIGPRGWDVPDGRLILTRPRVPHVFRSVSSSPWSFYWLHFSGTHAREYAELLQLDEEHPLLCLGDTAAWIGQFDRLFAALTGGWSDSGLAEASTALAQLLTATGTLRVGQNARGRRSEQRILDSIEFMTEHFSEPLTLSVLARRASLSVPRYSELFSRHAGTSPLRHLAQIRLRFACGELKYTDRPIGEIALDAGFEDPLYFSRLFRKHLGCSPREFRRRSFP